MSPVRKVCLAAAIGLTAAAAHAMPVNLLVNGDFEANIGNVASGTFTVVNAGSSLITGWTVGSTSVDLIRNNFGSIDNVSIDLAGSPGPGSLSQTFSVIAGMTYELEFDHFRNSPGTPLTLIFGGLSPITLAVPTAIVRDQTYLWTAPSTCTAGVTFSSGSGNGGPTIDNVSVRAVPVPQTVSLALAGLAAMAAVSRRRRHADRA
jgi:choice-of-anchor C domain-containing protein